MKKWLVLLMTVLLLVPVCAATADSVVINKIEYPLNDFAFPEDAKLLEIYFPKIYDCSAAVIRYGEHTMLFDCADLQWPEVKKLLDMLGVTELTYACNSHPHTDHIFGFQHVLKEIPAGEFLRFVGEHYKDANDCALKVYDQVRAQEIPIRQLGDGDTIPFGDVNIRVLQTLSPDFSGNNESALLMVELGERRFLFASDIQMASQKRLVAEQADLRADILQYPHHGYNRMQQPFLTAVGPELVIVTSLSSAANGAELLREKGIDFHYTNRGIVKMTTDGNVWVVERLE
jgi:beta-lactamase superfamily II metal-dependent hydrolase